MKILITGGNGQVAYDLKRVAPVQFQIYAPTRTELNIAELDAVKSVVENFQPDFVLNTAAYTQVDHAEKDQASAFAANALGAKNVAQVCQQVKCPLIHLSTDYVFDGHQSHAYSEQDAVDPINVYGQTKLQGEQFIQEYCEKYIILRVSGVFGVHGNNFVKTILRLARERDELRVVADQFTCPTPAFSIATTLFHLCEHPQWGLFHYCSSRVTSWYEFANAIIEKAKQFESLRIKQLQAITTQEYPTLAKRPSYSVLDCKKMQTILGIQQPNWETGLTDVIQQLYSA